MRKGFFLTESEKYRISDLYGGSKMFLSEAIDPPTGVDQIKDFQKWMDEKYGAWAESKKNPGTYYKVVGTGGYGNFGSQTKKAWESEKGDEYRKEKGISGSSVTVSQEKKWWVWNNNKSEGAYTIDELKEKISKGELTQEVKVFHPSKTGGSWVKANSVKELELPPSMSGEDKTVEYEKVKGTTVSRPETSMDKYYKTKNKEVPGPENLGYRTKTTSGFTEWAKTNLNTEFDVSKGDQMNIEGNRMTVTDRYGVKRYYDYDDKSQEWKHPNMANNIKIVNTP